MSEAGEKDILEAVDKKVNIRGGSKTGVKQELLYPENYQSIVQWQDFATTGEESNKLLSIAKRLRACGCNKLTETSFAAAAAVALHNQKAISRSKLERLRTLKRLFASLPASECEGPEIYPTHPDSIREKHPALWQQIADDGMLSLIHI